MSDFFTYKNIIFNKNPKFLKYLHVIIEDKRYIDNVFYIHDRDNNSIYDLIEDTFDESSVYREENKKVDIISILIEDIDDLNNNFKYLKNKLKLKPEFSKTCLILDISSNLTDFTKFFINHLSDGDIIIIFNTNIFSSIDRKKLEQYYGLFPEIIGDDIFIFSKISGIKNTYINSLGA